MPLELLGAVVNPIVSLDSPQNKKALGSAACSEPAKTGQQCAHTAWGPLGSGNSSTLGLVTGTISG